MVDIFESTGAFSIKVVDVEAEEVRDFRDTLNDSDKVLFDEYLEQGVELDELRDIFD